MREDVPGALELDCPQCGLILHEVLSGRMGRRRGTTLQAKVRCPQCGTVRSVELRNPAPVAITVMVSDGPKTRPARMEFEADEVLWVDQVLETPNGRIRLTSLEKGGARVRQAMAGEADAVWARSWNTVALRFSVQRGGVTRVHAFDVDPEETVAVGEVWEVGGERVEVLKIKSSGGVVQRAGEEVEAGQIRRVYARPMETPVGARRARRRAGGAPTAKVGNARRGRTAPKGAGGKRRGATGRRPARGQGTGRRRGGGWPR